MSMWRVRHCKEFNILVHSAEAGNLLSLLTAASHLLCIECSDKAQQRKSSSHIFAHLFHCHLDFLTQACTPLPRPALQKLLAKHSIHIPDCKI